MSNNLITRLQTAKAHGIDQGVIATTAVASLAFYNTIRSHFEELPEEDVEKILKDFDSEMKSFFSEIEGSVKDPSISEVIAYHYDEIMKRSTRHVD